MRDALTGVAVLILLALTAALVGPHFVDWDSRRGAIAERLSAATGQDVTITGPIGLELLPTPALKLSHVTLKDGALQGSVGRFKARLAIPALLRGRLQITEALVQSASISYRPGLAQRTEKAPQLQSSLLGAIGFDKIAIRDSRFTVMKPDGEPRVTFGAIDGDIEASSLLGPFRGAVSFQAPEGRRVLRFSTGRLEENALRLRALVEHDAVAMRADYDGVIRLAGHQLSGEGRIAASGTRAVALPDGVANIIWRFGAKLKGTAAEASLDDIELALGNTDRQAVFTGSGDFDLARTPVARITLATRQLDIERLLSEGETRAVRSPEALLRGFQAASETAAGKTQGPSAELDISLGSLLIGGDVVIGPRLILSAGDGRHAIRQLSAELPGRTQFSIEGTGDVTGDLSGKVTFESRDLAKLSGWFHGVPARPLVVRAMKLSGDLTQRAGEVSVSNALLSADDMQLAGTLRLMTGGASPRLELRLTADQVDVAKLPELPEGEGSGNWDFDVAVDARRVRYSGVGAGDISLKLRKEGNALTLDDLRIANLDGANLVAHGTLGGATPQLAAELKATRLDALLRLSDRLSGHWGFPLLATRAGSLSPADLRLNWTSQKQGTERQLAADGTLGGTAVTLRADLTAAGDIAGPDALSMTLKAPTPDILIRQIGLEAIKVAGAGPVDLSLRGGAPGAGKPSGNWLLKGTFGGLELDVASQQTNNPAEPFTGKMQLSSRDLSPLAQTLLMAVPAVAPGQDFKLDAGFDLRGYRITLRNLAMTSGSSQARGEIAFNLAEFGRVAGQLKTTRLDATSIAPLIFGGAPKVAGSWNRSTFGPAAAVTLPGDLWIDAEGVDLGDGLTIERPKFVLRFDNGLIFIEHAEGDWMNGRLKGNATFRRNQQNVSFTGRFGLEGWQLDRMPVRTAGGNLRGLASAQIDLSATGDSPFALVSALAGSGRLDLRETVVAGLTQGALAGFLSSPEKETSATTRDAVTQQLSKRLEGSLTLPPSQSPLSIAAGVMRAGPFRVVAPGEEITSSLAIDLRDFTLNARTGLVSSTIPKGWSGPAPSAELLLRGPLHAPSREVDVSALTTGLTALAIQRETERIEMLEQDQRERSFFNRRLRASEDQRRAAEEERRREEAQRREEAARREAQQRLQREQDLRQRFGEPPLGNAPLQITPPLTR